MKKDISASRDGTKAWFHLSGGVHSFIHLYPPVPELRVLGVSWS